MTKDEAISMQNEHTRKSRPILGQFLFFAGVSLIGGGIGAAATIAMKDGVSGVMIAVCGSLILIGSALLFAAIKVGDFDPPGTKTKTGQSQLILLVCVILGALGGIYANVSGAADRFMDGDFSISQTEGIVLLVMLFLIALPVGLLWQKQVDEHQRAAAKDAGYIALCVYIYGYLGMMIAASAGFIPWIGGPTVFLIVLFLFLFIWMVKRAG